MTTCKFYGSVISFFIGATFADLSLVLQDNSSLSLWPARQELSKHAIFWWPIVVAHLGLCLGSYLERLQNDVAWADFLLRCGEYIAPGRMITFYFTSFNVFKKS
jgi:hypothetical protein